MNQKPEITREQPNSSLEHLPIIGICGFSGAGKTTLIEAILPELRERGLQVAVVKHDCRDVMMDRPGKDSYRLYEAGADVFLLGNEKICRIHSKTNSSFVKNLVDLARSYDLVLIEGHGRTPVKKIWLLSENETEPPKDVEDIMVTFSRDGREESLKQYLLTWFNQIWFAAPVWGCILIGGQSRRMGQPKHLLQHRGGTTWLESAVRLIEPFVEQVVLSGSGSVPPELQQLTRLPDVPGVQGPLSGILSATRWQPQVSWLLLACDMPDVTPASIRWLLDQRRPGTWGVVPIDQETDRVQPLLAYYDARCGQLFEHLNTSGILRIGNISKEPKVATPEISQAMASSWRNINTPEELKR